MTATATITATKTITDAIDSVQNGATGITDRHFNLQFIDLQFQNMSSRSWKQHLTKIPSNDEGNKNLNYFHKDLNRDLPTRERTKNITEDKDDVVACMDGKKSSIDPQHLKFGGNKVMIKR